MEKLHRDIEDLSTRLVAARSLAAFTSGGGPKKDANSRGGGGLSSIVPLPTTYGNGMPTLASLVAEARKIMEQRAAQKKSSMYVELQCCASPS